MAGPGRFGGMGMLDGGGGRVAPGGLGGSGNLPVGGGGGENLPGRDGALGALGAVVGAAALDVGRLICIVVRDDSSAALLSGRLICIVVRDDSSTALLSGRLMRMVSRVTPVCEGRLMRMVSFFTSPMRTVSFFTLAPEVGMLMRMVSFLPSTGEAPGFGGRVMRTVAFLERLWSCGLMGGVGSSAIVGSICIASAVRGVNLWMHEIRKNVEQHPCSKERNLLLARIFSDL